MARIIAIFPSIRILELTGSFTPVLMPFEPPLNLSLVSFKFYTAVLEAIGPYLDSLLDPNPEEHNALQVLSDRSDLTLRETLTAHGSHLRSLAVQTLSSESRRLRYCQYSRIEIRVPQLTSQCRIYLSHFKAVPLRFNPEYKQLFDHCYDTSFPIGARFSRDWDNWERGDFFRVLDNWMDVTEAELVLNRIYKLPKPIVPFAFLNAHECHLIFEAGSEYYYYDGADGHLYRYEPEGFADRDDFLKNFMVKAIMKEIPWPDDAKAIIKATQVQQWEPKSVYVQQQRLTAKASVHFPLWIIISNLKVVSLRSNPKYKQLFDHCYDATSPIGAGLSRDWDNWQRIDFFKVRDSWMDVTEAELVLNKIYKLPKPIIPLAFLDAHDYHLLFEAGSEYYYLDGADGHLFQYETRFVDRDDFLMNFLEKGHMKEIPWPEDAKAIGYETQWQQREAKLDYVHKQQLAAQAADKP
ncbi:hypothetical protein DFH06DRAFT_1344842 [Mycena polygramma]|nr:hypothetical protein DFH06DRAFT_1344842 [Mycena polygramma]